MFARASSGTVIGVEAHSVVVEAYRGKGLPGMALIGLARGAVRESLVRVRAAIVASQIELKPQKVVVNMMPAELPKEASALDLPLAVALLAVAGVVPPECLEGRRFFGELSLGGTLEPVRGAVLMADLVRRQGERELLVPHPNASEASIIPHVRVVGLRSLSEVVAHLNGTDVIPASTCDTSDSPAPDDGCLSEVRGQSRAKRALEIAAAGGHNVLLIGPPGSGKTMLARRLPGLLPPLHANERIEITRIHSAAGILRHERLIGRRPFRSPHHTASDVALCGGGTVPRPGEVTLAHRGVLFLDELPEFGRRSLEALREPLEEKCIHVARASMSVRFPASVMLVAAMNPCPCGRFRPKTRNAGSTRSLKNPCLCTFEQVQRYQSRVSGPLLDRIDLHIVVDALPYRDWAQPGDGETSTQVRYRVVEARARQHDRLGAGRTNSLLRQNELSEHVPIASPSLNRLENAIDQHGLSARAVGRVLKVARTIADLEGDPSVQNRHLDEAIDLRVLDRYGTAA